MFVIRTQDGRYVRQLGLFTRQIDQAVRFSSRINALGECVRMGAVLDHAAIVPYSPQERAEEAGEGNPPPAGQEPAENRGTGSK